MAIYSHICWTEILLKKENTNSVPFFLGGGINMNETCNEILETYAKLQKLMTAQSAEDMVQGMQLKEIVLFKNAVEKMVIPDIHNDLLSVAKKELVKKREKRSLDLNYPQINRITQLSDSMVLELDRILTEKQPDRKFSKNMLRNFPNNLRGLIMANLVSFGILNHVHVVKCYNCRKGNVSQELSDYEYNEAVKNLQLYEDYSDSGAARSVMKHMEKKCNYCLEKTPRSIIKEIEWASYYVFNKKPKKIEGS